MDKPTLFGGKKFSFGSGSGQRDPAGESGSSTHASGSGSGGASSRFTFDGTAPDPVLPSERPQGGNGAASTNAGLASGSGGAGGRFRFNPSSGTNNSSSNNDDNNNKTNSSADSGRRFNLSGLGGSAGGSGKKGGRGVFGLAGRSSQVVSNDTVGAPKLPPIRLGGGGLAGGGGGGGGSGGGLSFGGIAGGGSGGGGLPALSIGKLNIEPAAAIEGTSSLEDGDDIGGLESERSATFGGWGSVPSSLVADRTGDPSTGFDFSEGTHLSELSSSHPFHHGVAWRGG